MISGAMLSGLIRNYVHAINQGAVPNIESAWTYICKTQCQKIFDECLQLYAEGLSEKLVGNFPLGEDALKEIHKELKQESEDKFKYEYMAT